MVEQLTLNQLVPGSSPGGATRFKLSGQTTYTLLDLFLKRPGADFGRIILVIATTYGLRPSPEVTKPAARGAALGG